jgi:hypothetical protein
VGRAASGQVANADVPPPSMSALSVIHNKLLPLVPIVVAGLQSGALSARPPVVAACRAGCSQRADGPLAGTAHSPGHGWVVGQGRNEEFEE